MLQSEEVPSASLQANPMLQIELLRSRPDLLLGSCPDLLCSSCCCPLLCGSCCRSLLRCSSFLLPSSYLLQGQEVPSAPLPTSEVLPSATLQEEPLLLFQLLDHELLRLV